METRKIVKSGNTSYTLALPISWVRKNSLEKDKLVNVTENDQGDLIISSERQKIVPKKEYVTIKVDGKDDETINLEFLTAYIRDASQIIFEGKEISPKTSKILELIKNYIGLDVIEQSTKTIVVKNFFWLDKETSPSSLIRKMDIINRSSFELLSNFFEKNFDNDDFFELQKLNEQNERLYILIKKSFLKLFEYPRFMKTLQTNYLQISKEKEYAQALRNISLALLSTGKTFLFLDSSGNTTKRLQKELSTTYENYQSVINTINNNLPDKLHKILIGYTGQKVETDKFLKTLDDPLVIQAINSISIIHHQLEEMSYGALL
tara:strand:- start:265 stop:1224 length:960 start_codon:yes stop_codon:yes gene_type:complete